MVNKCIQAEGYIWFANGTNCGQSDLALDLARFSLRNGVSFLVVEPRNWRFIDDILLRKEANHVDNELKNNNVKIQYLNFGEEDQMEIEGFVLSKLKTRIVNVFCVLTLGILRLVFHWYPHLHLVATHENSCLKNAETVLIKDNYNGKVNGYFVKSVKTLDAADSSTKKNNTEQLLKFRMCDGSERELPKVRVLKVKKLTYVWDDDRQKFMKLAGFEKGMTRNDLHEFKGQSEEAQAIKRIIYGNNEINVPVQTIMTLLILEALTPFYIFQLFSLIVWFAEYYYYYTVAIIIMSVFGIGTSIIQTRKNQMNLKGTVHSTDKAIVCRGNHNYEEVPASDLVPGDVILIQSHGTEMQCDAVLLSGSCVVNESMLTGESVPVTKTSLPNNFASYSVKEDVNHTLFCGTKVIQTRCRENEEAIAVVVRTGFLTTKGELVRSILYPPPADFKFDQDSYKFIGILCFIATLGFIYTVASKVSRNIAALDILIKALDIITIAIPPALPAAMTVGKLYALNRLKRSKIFCINSRVINVSGSVNCVCFDKTGTLTEDELDMWGVVPVKNNDICEPLTVISNLANESLLLRGMASCHTLSRVNDNIEGDPLDVKMFQSTGWYFEDRHGTSDQNLYPLLVSPSQNFSDLQIGVVKQFQFFSSLQRMSVITKSSDKEHFQIFCKGSPEIIISLSTPSSIPENIEEILKEYTRQGYRVIAMSTKCLDNKFSHQDVMKLQREEVECNLEFLGLIVLENKLKPQTTSVIKTLKDADMKIVMITGDNIQTAVTVAKECHIIPRNVSVIEVVAKKPTKFEFASIEYHLVSQPGEYVKYANDHHNNLDVEKAITKNYCFVVSGQSWENLVKYFPDLIQKVITKGCVFARMSGAQKQQLIEQLKILDYYVAMCGDGANDCGALKAAHVGISLSEAESSVASPFTSQEPNISCTPKIIKEGRAALVTSFGVFKMMLCYSLTEFASVIILYTIDTNLTSFEYLFIDVVLILNFSSSFGITKAYDRLAKRPPMTSLLTFVPITSIALFMFLTVVFQVFAYHFIQTFDWFEHFVYDPDNAQNFYSYENYAVFSVSMFQYISMAIVFSKGKPYRKPLYTNKIFTFSLIFTTILCGYMALYPAGFIVHQFELKMPPTYIARLSILGIAFANFFIYLLVEDLFIEVALAKVILPKFYSVYKSKRKYLRVLKNLESDSSWPNVMNTETVILKNITEGGYINRAYENGETVSTTRF